MYIEKINYTSDDTEELNSLQKDLIGRWLFLQPGDSLSDEDRALGDAATHPEVVRAFNHALTVEANHAAAEQKKEITAIRIKESAIGRVATKLTNFFSLRD